MEFLSVILKQKFTLHLVSFREEHERIGDIIKKYSHFLKVT